MTAPAPRPVSPLAPAGQLTCPFCEQRRPLQVFPRYEAISHDPLRFCPACYGFWAQGDALVNGAADGDDEHPALHAALAPRRCRACLGFLDDSEACRKCGQRLPLLRCPSCGEQMQRTRQKGIAVDMCAPCRGIWFDVGELGRICEVAEPLTLAARVTGTTDPGPDDSSLFGRALATLLSVFVGFGGVP